MKSLNSTFLLILCIFLSNLSLLSQSVVTTIKPGPAQGMDAFVTSYPGNEANNFGTNPDVAAVSWTSSGLAFDSRTYLSFDLSAIPTTATIQSANLNLFFNSSSGHAQGHQGSNACFLRRVTSPWTESAVSWNTQPQSTAVGEVSIPMSTSSSQDYLGIGLTSSIQDMVTNPSSNYGFVLMLQTEATFRSMVCASSDHSNSNLWPELVVVWIDSVGLDSVKCVDLSNAPEDVSDAWVTSFPGNENTNYGSINDIAAVAWTSGNNFISRSYFEFDLSPIPANSSIVSADMSLMFNPNSGHAQGHQSSSGSNEGYIRTVTSSWSENQITWNNQPAATSLNEVFIPQSLTSSQDYFGIDMSTLIQNAIDNPTNYFGFQFALGTEVAYRSLVFASSDHQNQALRPTMRVCYENESSVSLEGKFDPIIKIYPNPATSVIQLYVENAENEEYYLNLISSSGVNAFKLELSGHDLRTSGVSIDIEGKYPSGLYFISLVSESGLEITKTVILQ